MSPDLTEARAILSGSSAMLCERRHLEAIQEFHEVTLIQIINQIEALKQSVLNRE